jgi:LysR family hydrogen peroxide-inducible transcriptional activator
VRPSIRHLEYAVAVADARHFGRAARACHVTQPALSAQIQSFEELLGVQLFERSRRGVTPTPVGRWVVARARAILEGLDELADVASGAREPLTGPLQMGVIPTVAPYLLPAWLPHVRKAWPRLRLFLHEGQTETIVEQLVDARLDVLLLALPVNRPDVVSYTIFREPFVLIAPRDHPLGRRRTRVREDELAEHAVLLLEDGHCLRDQALSVCRRVGARETSAIRATSLTTLVQMVIGGLGVTLVPASAVDDDLRGRGEIAIRRFQAPVPGRDIGLLWRRTSPRGEEFEMLGRLLAKHAPSHPRASEVASG